jgi:uncharacterized protein (TIGR04255 family)
VSLLVCNLVSFSVLAIYSWVTMDYPRTEAFPSSPLALVAAEVRFNDSARLRQQATVDAISIALEHAFPVQDQFNQAEAEAEVRLGAGPQVSQTSGRTFKNSTSTAVATLSSGRLSLETTSYSNFVEFRELMLLCCRSVGDAGVTPALQRVGLRYIDEIRVPDAAVQDARRWDRWIDSRLVGHLTIGPQSAQVQQAEGVVAYRLPESGLNIRFAALPRGAVISPAALVRHEFNADQPLFVLDFDGYQEFGGPDVTLMSVEVIARTLDAVHAPTGEAFQSSITEEARQLFRK